MNDKPAILVGLAVFLALATFPGWYTLGAAALFSDDASPPDLPPPAGALEFSATWSGDAPGLAELRAGFASNGLAPLSQAALLTEDSRGGKWRVSDGQRRYLVLAAPERGELQVYDGCVEEVEEMRANHMTLLIEWRDGIVRHGDTSSVVINGRAYTKSLTGTCVGCHTDHQAFCEACHDYVNTLPAWPARNTSTEQGGIRCWNCHLQPAEEANDG